MLREGDRKAAFAGMIIGAIALFSILLTVVKFTNQNFARKEPAAEATSGARH